MVLNARVRWPLDRVFSIRRIHHKTLEIQVNKWQVWIWFKWIMSACYGFTFKHFILWCDRAFGSDLMWGHLFCKAASFEFRYHITASKHTINILKKKKVEKSATQLANQTSLFGDKLLLFSLIEILKFSLNETLIWIVKISFQIQNFIVCTRIMQLLLHWVVWYLNLFIKTKFWIETS